MASVVDICNMALSSIRAGTINSLTERSEQSKQCALHYPILRDQMLEESPWQFASGLRPLSLLVQDAFGWDYVYQYPSDCLRINRVIPDLEKIDSQHRSSIYYRNDNNLEPSTNDAFKVDYKVYNSNGNKTIAANYPNLRIDYRFRVDDPTLFSQNFTLALTHLLASHLAIPIVGVDKGVGLRQQALGLYQSYLNAGIVNELNEQHNHVPDSDFITVRN